MRNANRSGGGTRRKARGDAQSDSQPDLFRQQIDEAVKQAFAAAGTDKLASGAGAFPDPFPSLPVAAVEVGAPPAGSASPLPMEAEQIAGWAGKAALLETEPAAADPEPGVIAPARPIEPLPARMLNEFVYCPRLFYYEHVEGVFVENADTLRGTAIHKRVDKGSGAMPAPNTGVREGASTKAKKEAEPATTEAASEPQVEVIHSRSVMLGSERLGVVAKLDLVEARAEGAAQRSDHLPLSEPSADSQSLADAAESSENGEASSRILETCPVDYKAGAPREGLDGNELWPADRMQLGLQMLLLRDNGYRCERGIIYYRATRQRVPLLFTPELETWVEEQIVAARAAMAGPIPPPLQNSPKCVRCSLNSVCLPDETRLLVELGLEKPPEEAAASSRPPPPPRQLLAPRVDTRVLYLNTPGLRVGRSDEVLVVKEKEKTVEQVRISDLTHVALFGNIQISTQAMHVLCEKEVPLTLFTMGGWFHGILRGHEQKNVFTRIRQFQLTQDPLACLRLARRFVQGKIRNHRTMLMRLHVEPPESVVMKLRTLADSALRAESIPELLGTEGAAAHFYFGAFAGMLKTEDDSGGEPVEAGPEFRFNFTTRNRRPPTDPVNALLSLAYSMLAKDCTLAAMAVGLDPYVGFYHQPRFGRPALALDVMEEFRPLIAESAVLTAINNRMILPKHFVRAGEAVNLTPAGRKLFFQAYEQRMTSLITHPIFEYKVSYRRVIELQFRLLARALTNEIPEYPPFLTR